MIEELGMMPAEGAMSAWKSGLVTFFSFLFFGGVPMFPYLFDVSHYNSFGTTDAVFWIAIAIFLVALFVLGAVKGVLSAKSWIIQGLILLVTGSITTGLSWVAGHFLQKWTSS